MFQHRVHLEEVHHILHDIHACDYGHLLLGDGARKLADGDQLMWKQTVLVRGDDQPVGNPKRKV
jgi:hypothetical protein